MKKLVLSSLAIFTISLIVTMALNRQAIMIAFACQTFKVDDICLTETVGKHTIDNPQLSAQMLDELATLRKLSLLSGDYRVYSLPLHKLGHTLYSQSYDFLELATVCPPLIKDGCVHGFVMEYAHQNSIEETINLCDSALSTRLKLGCLHALGHSYQQNQPNVAVEVSTEFCSRYDDIEYVACTSGLFHEYSRSGTGIDHDHYYTEPGIFQSPSCDSFTGKDYEICYGATGSFRQYLPGLESIEETYSVCQQAKTATATELCKYLVRQRLDIARGFSFVVE